jgi:hypothetical protein
MSPLEAVERAIEAEGDADDVLRAVVRALVTDGGAAWAGILFVENGELVLGPEAGEQAPAARIQLPVVFDGERVAELVADGCDDGALLERVAQLIPAYCLVGWDTGGIAWDPDA